MRFLVPVLCNAPSNARFLVPVDGPLARGLRLVLLPFVLVVVRELEPVRKVHPRERQQDAHARREREVRPESVGSGARDPAAHEEHQPGDLEGSGERGHRGGGVLGEEPRDGLDAQLGAASEAEEEHAEREAREVIGGDRRDEDGAEEDAEEAAARGALGAERVADEARGEAAALDAPSAAREHRAELFFGQAALLDEVATERGPSVHCGCAGDGGRESDSCVKNMKHVGGGGCRPFAG